MALTLTREFLWPSLALLGVGAVHLIEKVGILPSFDHFKGGGDGFHHWYSLLVGSVTNIKI